MARPIRFKKEPTCNRWAATSRGGEECTGYEDIDVPMQDWKFQPEHLNVPYTQGENYEPNTIRIQFPELNLWTGRNYKNVHFEPSILYQGEVADWLNLSSPQLVNGQFTQANIRDGEITLRLNNPHMPVGIHTANIIVKAYEVSNGEKTFIEQCPEPIKFVLNVKKGDVVINPDFRERKLFYNLDTQELTGDTTFEIPYHPSYTRIKVSLVGFDTAILSVQGGKNIITFNHPDNASIKQNYNTGLYRGRIELRKRGFLVSSILAEIPLVVTVLNNEVSRDFSVAPTEFDLRVSKTTNEVQTATANIYNPQSLDIQVKLSPSFLTNVRIENGELKFKTATLTNMPLGKYSGEIILVSGTLEKRVMVHLKVVQSLVSDFRNGTYYFALDKNKVSVSRTTPAASYIILKLEMYFKGFGRELTETQEYSYPYFRDDIELYPGEEVQDFFIKCNDLNEDNIWNSWDEQYHLALVNIIIKEFNAEDVELSESRINNIFFAPGRRPKCFPFFTDFGKRRVFEQSMIRINTDVLHDNSPLETLYNRYENSLPSLQKEHKVSAFIFEKHRFTDDSNTIIRAGDLQFIPFPEPKGGKVIHLFFENQNLVFDWFSCPGDYRKKYDFHHITDELTGEKFGSLETENLVLNTGWILREEIELINALLKSRICFIVIDSQIIKARPMGKKNEMYDTNENLYSMDLEFNIKQNERS